VFLSERKCEKKMGKKNAKKKTGKKKQRKRHLPSMVLPEGDGKGTGRDAGDVRSIWRVGAWRLYPERMEARGECLNG
jgi:hypothetical protein